MQFSPGVLQHADARVGQRLSTVVELHELGAAPQLQSQLEALRDDIALQRRRASLSLFIGLRANGQALAAASLGRAVGLPVLRIDLSAVVSKYIGETEKNLDRMFSDAEAANAILFFDEADALFGKRTDVHDAHDRYGNVEVSYFLRKLEAYPWPAILVTSLPLNDDRVFLQRVHHVLYFHTPLHPPKP
jgi:SpoVK/Ycf46/Vps4 family AAA+-type ATPase